jgi:hypothetical protein
MTDSKPLKRWILTIGEGQGMIHEYEVIKVSDLREIFFELTDKFTLAEWVTTGQDTFIFDRTVKLIKSRIFGSSEEKVKLS